jgi:hypothetical protein
VYKLCVWREELLAKFYRCNRSSRTLAITCVLPLALVLPHRKRLRVATISDDCSDAMVLSVRLTFLDRDDVLVIEDVSEILVPVQALQVMYSHGSIIYCWNFKLLQTGNTFAC